MEQEKNVKNEEKKKKGLMFTVIVVAGLILATASITYAYFRVRTTNTGTPSKANVSIDCIDISYSEENTINLDYQYPISDTYALANVTPVTVKVTNNCTANTANVNYVLALTSLSNSTGFIPENKIRYSVKKQVGSAAETILKPADYLSNLTPLDSGGTLDNLNADLAKRTNISSYANKTTYTIDKDSIANQETNTYKVYLWVDYYEGDANMYTGTNPTHDSSYDNSTKNQNFASAISLIVNAS